MNNWRERAACREYDPDIWFMSSGEEAKRICRSCPVRRECFELALSGAEAYGVWGGQQFTREGLPSRRGGDWSRRSAAS